MLIVALRSFIKLCRYRLCFALLSMLSLSITALSFLVLTEKGLYSYRSGLELEYVYVESTEPEDIFFVYSEIQNSAALPKTISISMIDTECTGICFDGSLFQMYMPYGRQLSKEELVSGSRAALLSLEYVRNLPFEQADRIWEEGIDLQGTHFDAVGGYTDIVRYFSVSELARDFPMPTMVTIPAEAYLALGRKPTMLNCRFAEILTKDQQEVLARLISSRENIVQYYVPGNRDSLTASLTEALSAYGAILAVSLIAVIVIVLHWFGSERNRYRVYLLCGARKRHIILFCTIDVLLLNLISYLTALLGLDLINIRFEGVFLTALPITWRLMVGVSIFTFCWSILLLRSLSLLKHYRSISSAEAS